MINYLIHYLMANHGYKIVLIGDANVGKSSLLSSLMHDKRPVSPTIGVAFAMKKIMVDKKEIILSIWDTAGQERFRSIVPIYYKNSIGCVCVFDVTNKISFINLKYWINDYIQHDPGENIKIMIVANKCDLDKSLWCTSEENIKIFAAQYGCEYFLTSCTSGENVYEAFYKLAESINISKNCSTVIDPDNTNNKSQLVELAEKIFPTKLQFTTQC